MSQRLADEPAIEAVHQWTRHLIPLPHEIAIAQAITMRPRDLGIRLRSNAGKVERQAMTELQELFRRQCGAVPDGNAFELLIGVLDEANGIDGLAVEGAERLKSLPHSHQAYLIRPQGANRLVVAALHEQGAYYGAATLRQLLEAKLTREEITIPLATITDWPDVEERGLWNFALDLIPWMASLKMNFAKIQPALEPMRRDQPIRMRLTPVQEETLRTAPLRAVNAVLTCQHYNYLHQYGMNEAYPELIGKGERSKCRYHFSHCGARAPCASQPALKQILAEWMLDAGARGAREISMWTTEFTSQCECEACLKGGQFQLETKATFEAWQKARRQYPNLVLRLFICTRLAPDEIKACYECIAMLPPEVKIEFPYGIAQPFIDAAAQGRWVAHYYAPHLPPGEYTGMRFYSTLTTDYVRENSARKFAGMYAISYIYSTAAYHRQLFGFHISALAERMWNLNGRDLKAFAEAWATREGYAGPQKVAEWVELMDPIETQLIRTGYGPFTGPPWQGVLEAIKARRSYPLGQGIFTAFPDDKSFEVKLAVCRTALTIAEGLGNRELVCETQYVLACIRSFAALNDILQALQSGVPKEDYRRSVRAGQQAFNDDVTEIVRAMNAKTALLTAEPKSYAETIRMDHHRIWEQMRQELSVTIEGLLK